MYAKFVAYCRKHNSINNNNNIFRIYADIETERKIQRTNITYTNWVCVSISSFEENGWKFSREREKNTSVVSIFSIYSICLDWFTLLDAFIFGGPLCRFWQVFRWIRQTFLSSLLSMSMCVCVCLCLVSIRYDVPLARQPGKILFDWLVHWNSTHTDHNVCAAKLYS